MIMKVRRVSFALVSAAFFAASAMNCGTAYANPTEANAALVRKAYATLRAGDAKGAVAEYSDAIASELLEPEMLANALLNRALAQQQLQDHTAAIADYDAALKLNVMAPALRSTALYNRGLSNQKIDQVTRAVEDFTASLLINPKFAQAFYSRGNALRDSGQLLFALSDYDRALRYNHPDKARVHYGSATTYLALKRPLDAKREFNAALEINPNYGEARAQLVLLGDQNAEVAGIDPLTTGSVGIYAGGTVAQKPKLQLAVSPPDALMASVENTPAVRKPLTSKLPGRLPEVAPDTQYVVATTGTVDLTKEEEVVAIEKVPAIPEPEAAAPEDSPQQAEDEPSEATQPTLTGWTVQVASAASEDAAWSTWKKMQTRHKVLSGKSPAVVKADLGTKGIVYRIRLGGFDEQASAKKACSKLKSGGVSCFIIKAGS
jgi:tetratricopeptide (TPR) repeat protein